MSIKHMESISDLYWLIDQFDADGKEKAIAAENIRATGQAQLADKPQAVLDYINNLKDRAVSRIAELEAEQMEYYEKENEDEN